jgi:hypothetical protein
LARFKKILMDRVNKRCSVNAIHDVERDSQELIYPLESSPGMRTSQFLCVMRFKNRYLVLTVEYEDGKIDISLTSKQLHSALKNSVLHVHGDFGLACVIRSLAGN